MKAPLLLEYPALYDVLRRYRLKKDAKDRPGTLILLSFGLWGNWYVEKGFSGLVCNDGSEMPIHTAHLHTPGKWKLWTFRKSKTKPLQPPDFMKITIPSRLKPAAPQMFDGLLSACKGLNIAVAMLTPSEFKGVTGQIRAALDAVKSALTAAGATIED